MACIGENKKKYTKSRSLILQSNPSHDNDVSSIGRWNED